MQLIFRTVFLALLLESVCAQASLGDERIGSFMVFDDYEEAIFLDGNITINTPLEFRRALSARPGATTLFLNSNGGLVVSGLLLADDVHERGLHTVILENHGCYSACSFVFLAGRDRTVEGDLGVHQVSSQTLDAAGAQYTVSDILQVLDQFDTPTALVTRMFRTPPEDMYVFSRTEIEELGLNRRDQGGYSESGYFVVMGTFGNGQNAIARRNELRNAGIEARVVNTDEYIGMPGGFQAVVLGGFDRSTAERWLANARVHVPDAFLREASRR